LDSIEPAINRMNAEASDLKMTAQAGAIEGDAVAFNVEERAITFGADAPAPLFSYESLSADVAEAVRNAVVDIRRLVQSQLVGVIETGRALGRVKESLPHGAFGQWLLQEFRWSESTALNYMRVAETFGENPQRVADLPLRTVYALSAPSTPDTARQAVCALVERGTPPGDIEVRRFIREHKRADVQARHAARAKAAKDRLTPEQRKKQEEKEQRRLRRAENGEKRRREEREAEISAAREAANLLLRDTPTDVTDNLAPLLRKTGAWLLMNELTKLVDERRSKLGGQ
jgi:hypothetical protein